MSATLPLPAATLSPMARGMLYGFAAVLIWGGYLAMARAGVVGGITAGDFTLIRYGTAGLVMLPWWLRHQPLTMAGMGWGRALALTLTAGPLFILLGVGGYAFAPLVHGAVAQPAAVVVFTTLLAALVLQERPGRTRLVGLGIVLLGIGVIAGPGLFSGTAMTPLGDAMFLGAGLLWASFTILARRWGIKAIPATAAVSVLSALVVVPVTAATTGFSHLLALPPAVLLPQILVQGALSGVVAVICFTRAAEQLGAARAALFPALVPASAILLGIPLAGEWPGGVQLLGLGLVSLGLLVAMGLLRRG
ncbi:DMT family transporter [Sediminicoccus sp. BL-A-41-H5]|uniref:DMT family transporter n=1 Tax=Sediminicoccus sp. BL-A-41-H5 TaxID=3421106 RepID=UPI003D66DD73